MKRFSNKLIAGVLLTSIATSSMAFANEYDSLTVTNSTTGNTSFQITSFADYNTNYGYGLLQNHWAKTQIETLVNKGGISGVPYGSNIYRFEADRSIKTAELLSIILRVSGNSFEQTTDWTDGVMDKAIELGIIPESMRNEGNKELTREKMAMILVNSEKNIRNKDVTAEFDSSKISDLNQADSAYRDDIVTAYALGLLAGTGTGYNPKGITTRAETCTIINRLFEYTARVDNAVQPETPTPTQGLQYEALPDGSNVGMYFNFPAEGQIGPDGKVITRDPETGILGFGQGQTGGIWSGLTYPNGKVIGEGSTNPVGSGGYDTYAKGKYENHGGYTYWTQEWNRIYGVGAKKLNSEQAGAPEGSVADINGNIVSGSVEDDNVYYVKQYGTWCIKAW